MIRLDSYADLRILIKNFKAGNYDLLIVFGAAGMGKTSVCSEVLGSSVGVINGHITPMDLYQQAYRYANKNIWFDDVEALLKFDANVGLLKQLCETRPVKTLQYNTSWDVKKSRNLPKEFSTKSKVLLTMNEVARIKNSGIMAILDRGILVQFDPSREEIEAYIKENFGRFDAEVMDFLNKERAFSLRDYVKCVSLKQTGFKKWKEVTNTNGGGLP